MSVLRIETAAVFEPLLEPARYKGAWGGRGSGKSHFFGGLLIEDCLAEPGNYGEGMRAVCIREVQKDLAQSSKLLVESKIREMRLTEADGFKVYKDVITTPKDGIIIFKGMNDYTADSIKSLEGFKRAWWEEAQTATQHSLNLLTPTIRADGSEKWFSWNPRRKTDPTDAMLRGIAPPTGSVVVKANWRDNPWFTKELELERQDCLRRQPEQYEHIWEGGYVTALDGAYYAKSLIAAREGRRIGPVAPDALLSYHAFFDIGGTGAKADAVAIWVAQFVGKEIRALNYFEAKSQPLAFYVDWLIEQGYRPKKTSIWLPHDGEQGDKVHDVSYESELKKAGFSVTVVKNQGKGAAKLRIEAGRKWFPSISFHQETTQPGLDALGWYHEKKDDARGIGLGPEHDWASHGSDAFGLMCVCAERIFNESSGWGGPIKYSNQGIV